MPPRAALLGGTGQTHGLPVSTLMVGGTAQRDGRNRDPDNHQRNANGEPGH